MRVTRYTVSTVTVTVTVAYTLDWRCMCKFVLVLVLVLEVVIILYNYCITKCYSYVDPSEKMGHHYHVRTSSNSLHTMVQFYSYVSEIDV